jgi:hypothetical protein
MLSFNSLGSLGRLGNQMFQYAALFSIARRRGFDFVVPLSSAQNVWREHQLFFAFRLPGTFCAGVTRNFPRVQPRAFGYDARLAKKCPDNVDLYGYFQSEKYFADNAAAVRDEFSFHPSILAQAEARLIGIAGPKISLHVRRGDYVANAYRFPPCDSGYYERALGRLPANLPVLVFSDDIAWCKEQRIFREDRFVFSENATNFADLCLMSLCDHHIIANSSFSWWGAWLARNPDKLVVAPERWFGPGLAHLDTHDLLPKRWMKID